MKIKFKRKVFKKIFKYNGLKSLYILIIIDKKMKKEIYN